MNEHEQILTSILDCRRVDLVVDQKPLTQNQQKQYDQMINRFVGGEPLQYIIGHTDFMGCKICVDRRALIPRPETEILVDTCLRKIKELIKSPTIRILELGTGSGNIAISLAKNLVNAHIVTVDVSRDALDLAVCNAFENNVRDKIEFIHGDMAVYLKKYDSFKFDVIISNPPYIATHLLKDLPRDVREEPPVALDGGKDGLQFYRAIIRHGFNRLNSGGFMIFEIGDNQEPAVKSIIEEAKKYHDIKFFQDYMQINRIVFAKLKD